MRWFGKSTEYKDLVNTLRDLHEIELRHIRLQDELRIMQRRDINLDGLKHRMIHGKSPKRTMLVEISPLWARNTKKEA